MWLNSVVTFDPKSHPAPLGDIAHVSMSSGSDHMRSQNGPSWGISILLSISLTWSTVLISGDKPAWMQNIFPSTIAAIPR
jgi:hypothetical protein